jgi:hypothetical protein
MDAQALHMIRSAQRKLFANYFSHSVKIQIAKVYKRLRHE